LWTHAYYKEKKEALAVASKEISSEVNTEKIKYVVVSPHQNTVKKHSPNLGNKTPSRAE
jgi:aromatic ring-opening dioxygenase LigB subunit